MDIIELYSQPLTQMWKFTLTVYHVFFAKYFVKWKYSVLKFHASLTVCNASWCGNVLKNAITLKNSVKSTVK